MILYKYAKPAVYFLFFFCVSAIITFAETTDCPKNSEIQQLKEKIIRLEAIQDNYCNNLALHSITIGIIMSVLVVLVGYSVYLQNKNALAEYKGKQIEIDKNIIALGSKQKSFEQFTKEQKKSIENIVDEQTDLHFEIFDTLHHLSKESYERLKNNLTSIQNSVTLSNSLLLITLVSKKSMERNVKQYKTYDSVLNNCADILELYIQRIIDQNIIDKSESDDLQVSLRNLEKCIKYTNVKEKIIIDRFNGFIERLQPMILDEVNNIN